MSYTNTPEVVEEALKRLSISLLMVSARENPERVEEHKESFRYCKASRVQHMNLYLLLRSR